MGRIATLWPAGIRSAVVTPSATKSPAGKLERAISTPSSGCRRMTGAGVIEIPPSNKCRSNRGPHPEEQAQACVSKDGRGLRRGLMLRDGPSLVGTVRNGLAIARPARVLGPPQHEELERRSQLRLAAGVLAGLRNLHPRIGRHQANLVEQRHELESHVDRAHRAVSARAMDAGIQPALLAFLDDLFVDFENFRLFAIELRHEAVGEAEVGGADI